MKHRRSPFHRPLFAYATLAVAMAGCGSQVERAPDRPTIYFDVGQSWTTTKRQVRFYDCRTGSMVCDGAASYLDTKYRCRCE